MIKGQGSPPIGPPHAPRESVPPLAGAPLNSAGHLWQSGRNKTIGRVRGTPCAIARNEPTLGFRAAHRGDRSAIRDARNPPVDLEQRNSRNDRGVCDGTPCEHSHCCLISPAHRSAPSLHTEAHSYRVQSSSVGSRCFGGCPGFRAADPGRSRMGLPPPGPGSAARNPACLSPWEGGLDETKPKSRGRNSRNETLGDERNTFCRRHYHMIRCGAPQRTRPAHPGAPGQCLAASGVSLGTGCVERGRVLSSPRRRTSPGASASSRTRRHPTFGLANDPEQGLAFTRGTPCESKPNRQGHFPKRTGGDRRNPLSQKRYRAIRASALGRTRPAHRGAPGRGEDRGEREDQEAGLGSSWFASS